MRAFRLALIAALAAWSIGAAHARFLQTDPVGYEEDPNLYVYVDNDPLNHSDPTGRIVETPWDVANVLIDAASLSGNVASGNIVGALVDVAGLAYDVTATAVPGLPAGAGALIQAGRAADDVAGAVARNAGDAGEGTIVGVSRSRHPEAASHIERAQAAGHPRTLTVDRAGATANRAEAMRGTPPRAGSDRDEYPPAMFKEGGSGSSVERINPSDNRGAGASVGRQCRSVPNGERVTIAVCD